MNFIKIILLIVTFLLSLSCYKNRQKESSALTNNFKFKTFIEVSKKKESLLYTNHVMDQPENLNGMQKMN
ncbi:hypothetical protein R8G61_15335 [Tenacibaculum maritimum]